MWVVGLVETIMTAVVVGVKVVDIVRLLVGGLGVERRFRVKCCGVGGILLVDDGDRQFHLICSSVSLGVDACKFVVDGEGGLGLNR